MRRFLKVLLWLGLGVFVIGVIALRFVIAPRIDADMNAVNAHGPYVLSDEAMALHASLRVADLHADSLLWARDPSKRHDHGHVDFPRLAQGGVKLQVFGVVTKSPRGLNFDENDGSGADNITLLAMGQLWPPATWSSLYARAAHQAHRLHAQERAGRVHIARTREDFTAALKTDKLIGILSTEGSHPLERKIENIDRLYDEGFRMMGITHFFDNALGGSLHGKSKSGLTPFGREALRHMEARGVLIDMAHGSEQSVREALAITKAPAVLSHGGVRSFCPRTKNRNLPDDVLLEMAARGSLIGIGYFEGVICDISPSGIADALIYAVDLLGEDVVALGSDFDGTVTTALDSSELAAITDALLARGMPEQVIAKVMGENAIRFFAQNLPRAAAP